ncbi:MAG: HEAT repeat domain-containing protein, partial [Planctomycetota bacterium]|nr:HEAT repeat domain-containing protein [Planctomycetota bacterium]
SWILHMLRSQVGEQMFRRCVKTYLQRHEYSSVVTEDLNAVLEELTGRSFDPFFDQWVYHARHPDLKVTYRWLPQAQLAKVTVKQTHKVDDGVMLFRFPTSLRFIVDGQRVDHPIQINKVKQDFYVRLTAKPTIVRFDPQYTVLADVTFEKSDKLLYAQLANHDDVIGRLLAVEALSKEDTHEAVEKLKTALQNDPFYGVRIAAADALREIHNDEAFEALAASLDQPDARVRLQVVEKIGQFYRPQTAALMRELLADEKNPAIAAAAIRTLGRFHGAATETVIFKYLRSVSYRNELADAAVAAIRMLGDAAHADKFQAVVAKREKAFTTSGLASALDALASICREQEDKTDVREFLTGYLNHPRERIRIAAVTALGTLGDPRSLPVLETLSSDEAADRVGQAAQQALKELSKKSPIVPDELIQLRDTVSELREQNEELRKDVDDLKKRLGAADEDDDQHENRADQDKDDK